MPEPLAFEIRESAIAGQGAFATRPVRKGERGRVFIFALRDMSEGEELHYDYAYERSGDETATDEGQYRCGCRTTNCRGSIMESKVEFERRRRAAVRANSLAARQRLAGQTRSTRAVRI